MKTYALNVLIRSASFFGCARTTRLVGTALMTLLLTGNSLFAAPDKATLAAPPTGTLAVAPPKGTNAVVDDLLGPQWPGIGQTNSASSFHPQRLLVKPRANAFPTRAARQSGMAALHSQLGTKSVKRFAAIDDLEVVELPKGANLHDFIKRYKASGQVEYAEPDYIYKANLEPNDPGFTANDNPLWNLKNLGLSGGTAGADIHAIDGWDIRTSASSIIVAVTDTGARLTHEDLAPNLVPGFNVLNPNANPSDDNGHGTHVAGIIGAKGNNSLGIVGVAWDVKLMPVKWLDANGSGYVSDAITAIDYARVNGASIVNASWGGPYYSQALYDAIASLRSAGIIFVAAAGNDAMNNDNYFLYPAAYKLDNIVAVAATTRTDDLAYFSDYGPTTVGIGAPGMEILSSWYTADIDYAYESGTSMAAPHVCGALALLQAQKPGEGYLDRIYRLYANVDQLPGLAGKCMSGGRLNIYKALQSTLSSAPPNDTFFGRLPLAGSLVTAFGSNVGATSQTGEPNPASVSGSHSVWWSWTAPQSGRFTVKTSGSGFNTTLGVYTGSSVTTLSTVGDNDDTYILADGTPSSIVVFNATSGTSYQILVNGNGSAVGAIKLQVAYTPIPANDNFANATTVTGDSISVQGSNVGASKEASEPNHAGNAGGASVWWSWQAPKSGPVIITTASSPFNTLLAVYTGNSVGSLTAIASNDDDAGGDLGGVTSEVRFDAIQGTTYKIAADGFNGQSGPITLCGRYEYMLTVIPPFTGANTTDARDINEKSQVAGNSYFMDSAGNIGAGHGLLWENGEPCMEGNGRGTIYSAQDLGYLELEGTTFALGLNNNAQVVGVSGRLDPPWNSTHGIVWDNANGMAWLDANEYLHQPSLGNDINASGAATGWRFNDDHNTTVYNAHVFRWTANQGVALLDTLGGNLSEGRRINTAGDIAGRSSWEPNPMPPSAPDYHACLWRSGQSILDLGTIGNGTRSSGTSLNDVGQVVGGTYINLARAVSHAFLWENNAMSDLGTIQFTRRSVADGINNNHEAVGTAFYLNGDLLATSWKNGIAVDLNRLVEPSMGWLLQRSAAVNDKGEIVGYGTVDGEQRAFILTPFALHLSNGKLISGDTQFQFELSGPNGRNYTVEGSTDLINWTTVATGTFPLNRKSATITDSLGGPLAIPYRFYRATCGTFKSDNSIGYISYYVAPGYSAIANQLNNPCGNTLNRLIPNAVPGSILYKYVNHSFTAYGFDDIDLVWVPDGDTVTLNPGEAALFNNVGTNSILIKLTGEVPQGQLDILVDPDRVLVSSMVPQAGGLTSLLGYQPNFGDQAFLYYNGSQTAYNFDDLDNVWYPSEPSPQVGQGMWIRPVTTTTWERNFHVFP